MDPGELVRVLVDVVSKNGNLLVGVGPDGAGRIIAPEQEALLALGRWLAVNGPAIYGTRPWRRAEGVTGQGGAVRFTRSGGALHAIVLGGAPAGPLRLIDVPRPSAVRVLGHGPTGWRAQDGDVEIDLPAGFEAAPAVALVLEDAA
jgi:alpha-L-fucosidase